MPQIANQDYNVVRSNYANNIRLDAYAHGVLRNHYLRGTIFDVAIIPGNPKAEEPIIRITLVSSEKVEYMQGGTYANIFIGKTPEQYFGLAAVQEACELKTKMPVLILGKDSESLAEAETGKYICVNGYLVTVVLNDGDQIIALNVSSEKAEAGTFVDITDEDLQKLIGLGID